MTGRLFLVDTGSEVGVSPRDPNNSTVPQAETLRAANGTDIHMYGQRLLALNLGLKRSYGWIFIVADVSRPIVGIDFLQHFYLLLEFRHGIILDRQTSLTVIGF